MNKTVKILLLCSAVIIAIGGILLFIKTIVSPPQNLAFENQHAKELKSRLEEFKSVDQGNLESDFEQLKDLINRFKTESVIDSLTFEQNYVVLIAAYAPKFSEFCFAEFQKHNWDIKNLEFMTQRIGELRKLTIEDGAKKIMDFYPESNKQFTEILGVIDNYKEARTLANNATFKSLDDAEKKIKKSRAFLQDRYLQNNTSLIQSLKSLPNRIENSHLAYLRNKVNAMAYYYNFYDKASYDEYSDKVSNLLIDYSKNVERVYGHTVNENISDLKQTASFYDQQANQYFKNK